MVIHVLLAVTFWHCESVAASLKAGKPASGAAFCNVGNRQQWPGEFASNNIKGIESTHFWAQARARARTRGAEPCRCLQHKRGNGQREGASDHGRADAPTPARAPRARSCRW